MTMDTARFAPGRWLPLVGLAVLAAASCAGPPSDPIPVAKTVTNAALGIRIAALPADFKISINEGDTLELMPSASGVKGRLWFSVGPEVPGVNLVAGRNAHQRSIDERPEAAYKGGQELVTQLGTAFYSRGQYLGGTTRMEETAIFVIHPTETRMLTATYRYPAGVDSSVRVQQLLDVVGEVEAISGTNS